MNTINHQPNVVLADTFPAKAHLLITHLTETDPSVASFSPDGASFYICDQAKFAQNLSRYFKHNNYGSFVRQLNLYGFNSSRLKENNDVVEWKHDSFHRDRKELINDIKRSKKKSSKPTHVHIDPRRASSPGMPSYSDEASSSVADSEQITGKALDRRVEYEWLEAEFSTLKRQNESLERKLDMLLQITLRINPGMDIDQFECSGEKRRRMNAVTGGYSMEEEKASDIEKLEIEPLPYEDARKMSHQDSKAKNGDNNMGDSLTDFMEFMMTEEESKSFEEDDEIIPEDIDNERTKPPVDSNFIDTHAEEDLTEEALMANLPEGTLNTDGDLFGLDENETALRNSSEEVVVAIANATMDKSPEPIGVITPSVPTYDRLGDIEEANMPISVHVVPARAELVEEDSGRVERRLMRHNKRVICLLSILAFAIVAFTITLPAVIITQRRNQKKKANAKRPPPKPCLGKGKGKDRRDCILGRPNGSSDETSSDGDRFDDERQEFPILDRLEEVLEKNNKNETELDEANAGSSISPQSQLFALHSVKYKDHSFSDSDESISFTINGMAYECTNL